MKLEMNISSSTSVTFQLICFSFFIKYFPLLLSYQVVAIRDEDSYVDHGTNNKSKGQR